MSIRETVYRREKDGRLEMIHKNDTILRIELQRTYREDTADENEEGAIATYPNGYEYSLTQDTKQVVDSHERTLPDEWDAELNDTIIEFDDGTEMRAEVLLDNLRKTPHKVQNKRTQSWVIFEQITG